MLKETHPDIRPEVEELQFAVTRSQAQLDEIAKHLSEAERESAKQGNQPVELSEASSSLIDEMIQELKHLEEAYQSLLALKHAKNQI